MPGQQQAAAQGVWDNRFGEGLINALGAGLVARGMQPHETFVELNPFGDFMPRLRDNEFSDDADADQFVFAFDATGEVTFSVTSDGTSTDPGLILWNGDSGGFEEISYGFGSEWIQSELAARQLYQAEVFAEDLAGTGHHKIEIDGPDAQRTSRRTRISTGNFCPFVADL